MDLIYICIFHQEKYINLLKLLIRSLFINGNINKNNTDILIITSFEFQPIIEKELSEFNLNFFYYRLNLYTIFESAYSRLNIFNYENINKYEKILYLDTDILINSDINALFNLEIQNNKLYTLEEGWIGHPYWGGSSFFDFSKYDQNISGFTTGILYFHNNDIIKELFKDIQLHINDYLSNNRQIPDCLDQPFINYNAITQNKYDNQLIKKYVENNPIIVNSEKIIYHFPGHLGVYTNKYDKMISFWKKMNYITPVIFQTNRNKPEEYVLDMIKCRLDNDWKYEFYDDNDVINFFNNNPIKDLPDIIAKYNLINKGAHKADLFRYYYLYINGGVFIDSDAMIYDNIKNIVKDYNFISVDSSCHLYTIFQGILGASPRNNIIKKALYNAYNTDPNILLFDYHYWCRDLYNIIKDDTYAYNIKLYKELRVDDKGDDILDDDNNIIFKHYWKYKIIPQFEKTEYTDEFTRIYENNYWQNGSGSGSLIENTFLYNKTIIDFIRDNNIQSITDIGCGDWQSSYLIYKELKDIDYLGIDCVKNIIKNNKINYPNFSFINLDVLSNINTIRNSDLYIIKDVLQHWKLKDIYFFLDNIVKKKFKYIIITNYSCQNSDDQELNEYIGNSRGLNSKYLPLKKYNAYPLLDYYGDEDKHICIINNNFSNFIGNSYRWGNKSNLFSDIIDKITFLEDGKMIAFGEGNYLYINRFKVKANFGGREHMILFNSDYTEFISTRIGDNEIIKGKLL